MRKTLTCLMRNAADANEKIRLHASFVLSHQRIWFSYKNYILPKSNCMSNFKNVSFKIILARVIRGGCVRHLLAREFS